MLSNKSFINTLNSIVDNYKTLYVSGCFGAPMTEANKMRYMNSNAYNRQPSRRQFIQSADANTFGFDCVCLIKGILWGWNADITRVYGGANYASNGVPDISEYAMIKRCKNVSADFTNIKAGELVYMTGHVGVYVGDGVVIECSPRWENGVQRSNLGNLPQFNSGHCRKWVSHGFLPWIDYNETEKDDNHDKEIMQVAYEVIAGAWGNGVERKKRLMSAGYNYSEVQQRVNMILKGR